MLSAIRKYRFSLILVHQYLEQIEGKSCFCHIWSTGTIIAFRVRARDAEYLAKEFYPIFRVEDFVNLPTYHIYLKLMIDGVTSKPFSAMTLLTSDEKTHLKENVINLSGKHYGKSREEMG